MSCTMRCRYYMEIFFSWCLQNKLIVFLSLLSFSLFVSTLVLSGQKGRLQSEIDRINNAATTTAAPTESEPPTDPSVTESSTNQLVTEPLPVPSGVRSPRNLSPEVGGGDNTDDVYEYDTDYVDEDYAEKVDGDETGRNGQSSNSDLDPISIKSNLLKLMKYT